MGSLELTALDGGRVATSGPDVPSTTAGCTAFAVLAVGNRLHEFTAGDAQFTRGQAKSLGASEQATYRMHGGLVRVSAGQEVTPQLVVTNYLHIAWEGKDRSLGTVIYQSDTSAALALLDAVEIQEEAAGIILRPRDERLSILQNSQHAPGVVVPVRGQGMLQFSRNSSYWEAKRPAWAGLKARGGDLYAEQTYEASATMLLFGPRAVTRIYVNDKRNELAGRAADVAAEWN